MDQMDQLLYLNGDQIYPDHLPQPGREEEDKKLDCLMNTVI